MIGYYGTGTVNMAAGSTATVTGTWGLKLGGDGSAGQASADGTLKINGGMVNCHLPWSVDSTVYWDAGNPRDRISKLANAAEYQGQWNHWVFTKDARTNSMAMYLNGVLWHSGAGASPISGITAFTIGSGVGGAYQYKGLIDDFRIYNCSLSAAQVDTLYKSF